MSTYDSTIPDTFEGWVEQIGIPKDVIVEYLDHFREEYRSTRLASALHPLRDDMPPCPAWCRYERGHRYETVMDLDVEGGTLTLERFHESAPTGEGDASGFVSVEEFLRDRKVSYGPLHIVYGGDLQDMSSTDARQRASSLLDLADQLDRLAQ